MLNQAEIEKLFGKPISVYTDREAVEDGLLVPVTLRDRVTRSVWEWLHANTPLTAEPPSCWPVEMMGWFRAGSITQKQAQVMIARHGMDAQKVYEKEMRDKKALALALGLIARDERKAREVYEQNIGGGIHRAFANVTDGKITCLCEGDHALVNADVAMWLIPNELNGVTLMFPDDY